MVAIRVAAQRRAASSTQDPASTLVQPEPTRTTLPRAANAVRVRGARAVGSLSTVAKTSSIASYRRRTTALENQASRQPLLDSPGQSAHSYGSEGWGFGSLRARPVQTPHSGLFAIRRWPVQHESPAAEYVCGCIVPCLSPMACLQHRSSWSQTRRRTDACRLPGAFAAFGCRIQPYPDQERRRYAPPLARRQRRALPLSGPPGARRAAASETSTRSARLTRHTAGAQF